MPDKQPETPETDAELVEHFDRWLVEASPSDFEEFITQAPQGFRTKSLEFLRELKARVDARLAAEPVNWVFSMSDPHEIRVSYWYKIADRFEAEINFHSIVSPQDASGSVADKPFRPGAERQPMVAARRIIVLQNHGISDHELCELLDRERIPPPKGWPEAGFKTWVDAYRNPMKLTDSRDLLQAPQAKLSFRVSLNCFLLSFDTPYVTGLLPSSTD
jgi:hypothetical protein